MAKNNVMVRMPQKKNKQLPKQKTKKKKKQGSKGKASPGGSTESKRYYNALINPFDRNSFDVRVPDQYSAPTVTYFTKQSLTLTSDVNGEIDLICFPNLVQCALSPRGCLPVTGSSNWSPGAAGVDVAGAFNGVDMAGFKTKMINHRIVSYGVRITNTASMVNVSGKVFAATLPISSWAAHKNIPLDGVAQVQDSSMTVTNILTAYGIPNVSSKVDIARVAMLPGSIVMSALQTASGTLQVAPKIIDAESLTFRSSDYTNGLGFSAFRQAAGTVYSADASSWRISGFESVVLSASGLPPNTALFDVELIYHLEGCQAVASSVSQILPSVRVQSKVDVVGMLQAVAKAATQPSFTNVVGALTTGVRFAEAAFA